MGTTKQKTALIIGAGPAGLTAAYELLNHTNIKPIVIEQDLQVGGLSKTINYKGNRIDIGGHRFFSKSNKIMRWWLNFLPLETTGKSSLTLNYWQQQQTINTPAETVDASQTDRVMLVRNRQSRIYYQGHYFHYPLELSWDTIRQLGWKKLIQIGWTYGYSLAFPRMENNLEDFLINRFGRELYATFFKSYTEKVWGVACTQLSSQWGRQRIKGVSVSRALRFALLRLLHKTGLVNFTDIEASLIQAFLYPKFGPGQMWQKVAEKVVNKGGQVLLQHQVKHIKAHKNKVTQVTVANHQQKNLIFNPDYVLSTMPVAELATAMGTVVPTKVQTLAKSLPYRDFVIVGLLINLKKPGQLPTDTWIYVHDPAVGVGRIQIFNNWSPWLVKDPSTVWLGMEYFCQEDDAFWKKSGKQQKQQAINELGKVKLFSGFAVIDSVVVKIKKAYPAYTGSYRDFATIRNFFDEFTNLWLVGRNGMHRYNNQDHSMLAAMAAVDQITKGKNHKSRVWRVNEDQEYLEERDRTNDTRKPPITNSNQAR